MFKLIREETPADLALADRHQWPVRVTAKNADNTPAYVFVMRQAAPGEWLSATFSCVASAQQMDDLPTTTPGPGGPFYRVATVTALCRNAEAAVEFGTKIEYAMRDLANNLASAALLSVVEEITITPDV
jgi:hypothetical protein